MSIEDYTTEELKAEIKRRQTEARRLRSSGKSYKAEYAYARAVITWASNDPFSRQIFRAHILDEDLAKMDRQMQVNYRYEKQINILRANFNKDTAPRKGDLVRIRSRRTKYYPDGFGLFCTPYIFEVIKRAGD